LVTLYVLRDFGAVTMWQYSTFTRLIYNRYLSYKLDAAAALAIVLVVLTVIVVLFEARARGKARYARLSAGSARRAEPAALGRWRWPALFFLSVVVSAGLVLPAATLLVWATRGWHETRSGMGFESWMPILEPAWNSLSVSLLAALLVTLAALPVAVLVVRRPGRLSGMLERITYTSYALPGIVVALALVFFGIRYAGALYQTLPLLLVAYVILFVPQALGAQRASLLQITPSLEEAGRSLGQRPWGVFHRITLPLLRPGLLAGAALVFLTTMKELPAALILSPLGYSTLATQIWSTINEAFFARAAVPTLLILLLSSLPLAYISWREHAVE
jgi:iron(III) transport system permease protein